MDTVVKGKLKLKGGKVTKPGSVKKQSTSDKPSSAGQKSTKEQTPPQPQVTKTKAELANEAKLRERLEARVVEMASKSHKDNVKQYNEYLEKLSEHNDIPRIGPG